MQGCDQRGQTVELKCSRDGAYALKSVNGAEPETENTNSSKGYSSLSLSQDIRKEKKTEKAAFREKSVLKMKDKIFCKFGAVKLLKAQCTKFTAGHCLKTSLSSISSIMLK